MTTTLATIPASLSALSTTQLAAITTTQIAALSTAQLQSLSAAQINSFTAAQIAAVKTASLTTAQIAGLSTTALGALSTTQFAGFSTAQLQALTATQLAGISTVAISALSPAQFMSFTTAQVAALGVNAVKGLSTLDLSQMSAAQAKALTTTALNAMSSTQLAALLCSHASDLTSSQISSLTPTTINSIASAFMATLSATQVANFTAAQLNGIDTAHLQALNLSGISKSVIAGLTATTIGNMTTKEFLAVIGTNISSLTAAQLGGITAADINGLTPTEWAQITSAQAAGLNSSAAAALAALKPGNANSTVNSVPTDVAKLEQNGSLSYTAMETILADAAQGGMDTAKLTSLTALAKSLNVGTGPKTSAYVQQIFDDVVLGNSANVSWNGGATNAVALGNLTATTSQAQTNELIGKWFLGTDLPATPELGAATYQAYSLPLFTSAGPQMTDVNQGQVGDCYFLAALAETAQLDPSLIQNMIQSNGNGTYSVEFQLNGQADYVTVNNQLATMSPGMTQADGSGMAAANSTTSLWVPLIEKAYAEFAEQSGAAVTQNIDSYAGITTGSGQGITAVTGQSVNWEPEFIKSMSATSATATLTSMLNAYKSGEDVIAVTQGTTQGNLIGGHAYALEGVNVAAGTVTLYNPWGANSASNGVAASFTASISQLESEGVYFGVATGKAAAA